MSPWANHMKGNGPYKGKGGPPGMWYYYEPGMKGQGGGKSKGKGAGTQMPQGTVEPAKLLATDNKGLRNTVEQLREANKQLRAKTNTAQASPEMPSAKTPVTNASPPAPVLDKKAPWSCRTCGLDHHNGNLKNCRACGAEREELAAQGPAPATVTAKYWGPVHDKASQKLLRRLPEASGLLLSSVVATPSGDEEMEPSLEEQQRLRANAAATVAFLEAQTPVDTTLLKGAKDKLAALTAQAKEKTLEKPDQDRGLLLVILDKQRLFNATEGAKDKASLEASAEKMLQAQEAHAALAQELEAAAAQREKLLDSLAAALKTVEDLCFYECQEKVQGAAPSVAPAPAQTASKQEAASMLEWLETLGGSGGAGGAGPPPACVTLLRRLQLLAGETSNVVLDVEDMGAAPGNGAVSPLVLPPSPTPADAEVSTSGAAVEAARAMVAATKGVNKGGPHPLGKGTAVGGHAPY